LENALAEAAVVLLSGGQDSTTCLYWAKHHFGELHCIGIGYGQRHANELKGAKRSARLAGVRFRRLDLKVLAELGGNALVDHKQDLAAVGGRLDIQAPDGLPTSFVPGRNALFLSVAAAYAVQIGAKDIITGVCQTDYSGYPDCREEFVSAMAQALTLAMPSSARPIRVHTPLMFLTKAETVHLARKLDGCWEALALTITCYEGTRCGTCAACELRARGFAEAGYEDPACVST
jgi:7-cyano-7-deazaguanine synthase